MSLENELYKLEAERKQALNQLEVGKNKYIKTILNGIGEDITENIDKPIVIIKKKNKLKKILHKIWEILQKINFLK